ncbi:MAG: trypsin-like peptidase domain-containing protein [Gammaproteobacteria bacterium]|nr:trypsin-like peptidase domain-containing protein [Gammaproteobacteria bacterium]
MVVNIFSMTIDPYRSRQRIEARLGSGVIVDGDGHVVTNAHVVQDAAYVAVGDERGANGLVEVEVVGTDAILDLAVLQLPPHEGQATHLSFADSDKLQVGAEVLAVGNQLGLGKTLTRGIVSGLARQVSASTYGWRDNLIQTDAAINPGSSGGPLFNRCGEVVGLNTSVSPGRENIGFAIPANQVVKGMQAIIEHGRIVRPWHGVFGRLVSPGMQRLFRVPLVRGLLVETVEPGSPADKLGLRGGTIPIRIVGAEFVLGGDIITQVNGRRLLDSKALVDVLDSLRVGQEIEFEYYREGQKHSAKVVLPERPALPGDAIWTLDEGESTLGALLSGRGW